MNTTGIQDKEEILRAAPPSSYIALRPKVLRLALPGIVLALVFLLPFLNKGFTIDDPFFLLEARQIVKTPTQPMAFSLCWMADLRCFRADRLGPGAAQGFLGYLLVPAVLAHSPEMAAHAIQALLACLAVVALVSLALRLGFSSLESGMAGLLLVATAPFLPMASTAMPDMAALALGLGGIERLLAWKQNRRWWQALIAGLALGLAPYARPHTLLLMVIAGLLVLESFSLRTLWVEIRGKATLLAPLFGGLCLLVSIHLITYNWSASSQPRDFLTSFATVPWNLAAFLIYLSFPIPLAAVWLAAHFSKKPVQLLMPAVAIVAAHIASQDSQSLADIWWMFAAVYGLVALVHMVWRYLQMRDRLGIVLSLWVLIPLPAVTYTHLPIKYMLAVLPGIILILVRTLSALDSRWMKGICATLIAAGAAYSGLLLKADDDFAEYGRRAAAELVAPHVAAGEKVWYAGQWGFYWYAAEAGGTVFNAAESQWKPGDLLAVGLTEGGEAARNRFPNRLLIDSRHYDAPHGRTMGYGAGLYSNSCGTSLWVWKPQTTNDYELWRID